MEPIRPKFDDLRHYFILAIVFSTTWAAPVWATKFQVGVFAKQSNAAQRAKTVRNLDFNATLKTTSTNLTRVMTETLSSNQQDKLANQLQQRGIEFTVKSNEPVPTTDQTISDTKAHGILTQLRSAYQVRVSEPILDKLNSAIGADYVWGGESPREGGFDCSGLLYWALDYGDMPRTTTPMWNWARPIDKQDIQPGDFIFFNFDSTGEPDHVGFYLGEGTFIHASSSYGVIKANFHKKYYQNQLFGIGRPPSM